MYGSDDLTFAKSIGWMTILANVAADPPQTKGWRAFAIAVEFESLEAMLSILLLYCQRSADEEETIILEFWLSHGLCGRKEYIR